VGLESIVLFYPIAVEFEDSGGYWSGVARVDIYGVEFPEDGKSTIDTHGFSECHVTTTLR
jgi:hypothetical protein